MPREPMKGFYQGQAGGMGLGNALAGDVNSVYQNGMAATRQQNELMQRYLNEMQSRLLMGQIPTPEGVAKANADISRWGDRYNQGVYTPSPMTPQRSPGAEGLLPTMKNMANSLPMPEAGAPPPTLPPMPPPAAPPMPPPAAPPGGTPQFDLSKGVFGNESPINKTPLYAANQQITRAVGPSDYSNMGFGQAHRTANTRGEPIFIWRGKRFNSRYGSDSSSTWNDRMNTNGANWQRSERVMPSGTISIADSLPPPLPTGTPKMPPPRPKPIEY